MKKVPFQIVSLDTVKSAIDIAQPVAFDVETHGFYGTVCLAQFYQKGWPEVLLVEKPDIFELTSLIKPLHIIAHAANYEIHTMQAQIAAAVGVKATSWVPDHWDCTLLLSRLAYSDKASHSLDMCYQYLLGFCPYGAHGLDKTLMQKSDWRKLDQAKCTYAALDVYYLLDLFDDVNYKLTDQSYILDKVATGHVCKLQKGGLPLNLSQAQIMLDSNQQLILSEDVPINVNSYVQVRPYIGEATSDDQALALFAINGNVRADKVRRVRKLEKQNSFLRKYLETSYNGRIFGRYSFTTRSGRGNCSDQNLQQIPRAFKELIEAPEGSKIVVSDFSQLELRMACAIANEVIMAGLFKANEDLHSFTAERVKSTRGVGKTCNFNLIYGGSANMLQTILMTSADILMPIEEVRLAKRLWHNLWPHMTAWQTQQAEAHRKGKTVSTIMGRTMKPNLYTDAMNLPVQGSAAEVAKLALHYQVLGLKKADLLDVVDFSNFVHDSYQWLTPDDPEIYEAVARIVGDSMKEAWHQIVQHTRIPDLPMPVTVQVGTNLGRLENETEIPIYAYEV